jgi:hypothetical protein
MKNIYLLYNLKPSYITYLLVFLIAFDFGSCQKVQNKSLPKVVVKLKPEFHCPKVFFKKFTSINSNKKGLFIYLNRNSNMEGNDPFLDCVFADSDKNEPIRYYGTIVSDHSFELESDEKTTIKGEFISASKIKIDYFDSKGKSIYHTELIETKGKFSVFSKNYHKDKLEINTGDTECDSTNSYININLLIFKSEEKKT